MQTQAVVLEGVANLFSRPDTGVDLVTQAILGTNLAILQSREGWRRVRLPDQYEGWIEAHHLKPYASDQVPYASEGPVAEVASLLAFLYREPSVSARLPARQVTIGVRLEVAQEGEGWLEIRLPGGSAAWIQKGDVAPVAAGATPPRQSVDRVVATARRLLGLPYLWGGTTPLGIDCSALVQLAYGLNGVQLLRDADIQFTQPDLAPVAREALRTGDLVFFGQERITHVGMYIGGGEFIHATTHLRPVVQISRLEEPHWTGLYQGARRP